jgi:arylsulfatase A-like enzyme
MPFKNLLILLAFSFTLSSFPFNASAQTKRPPNIIYIYADDLGYGELGCYGQSIIQTPHLDRMAREGMRFTQHYSSAPVCAPSRCMLLTGKHPGHSYIRGNYELGGFEDEMEGGQMPLHEGANTIAGMLKEKGYATGMIGKWGMGVVGTTGSPLHHGFDYYYGYLDQKQAHNYYPTHLWENDRRVPLNNPSIDVHTRLDRKTTTDADFKKFIGNEYAPALMTAKAIDFINSRKQQPFFLYLPYTIPHLALQVPEKYLSKYAGKLPDSAYYGERGYGPCLMPRATYAAMISFLDEQVGLLLEKLKQLELEDETIVFFSSDNGASFSAGVDPVFFKSTGGLRGLKMELYEGGIRVPFIARWPGKIPANTTTDHVSVQYDLMASIAELIGIQPKATDGISFLPSLLGKDGQQKKHASLYFEYPENGGQIAVRLDNWKGVKKNMRKDPQATWELYNLSEDPFEKNNLAARYPNMIEKISAIALREHQHPHLLDWEFIDPKVRKKD